MTRMVSPLQQANARAKDAQITVYAIKDEIKDFFERIGSRRLTILDLEIYRHFFKRLNKAERRAFVLARRAIKRPCRPKKAGLASRP